MILCDAGPLIALIDSDDPHHRKCVAALVSLPAEPMLTTWPCLAEAMYILGREGGLPVQDELWEYLADGTLRLHLPEPDEWQRMRALMRQNITTPRWTWPTLRWSLRPKERACASSSAWTSIFAPIAFTAQKPSRSCREQADCVRETPGIRHVGARSYLACRKRRDVGVSNREYAPAGIPRWLQRSRSAAEIPEPSWRERRRYREALPWRRTGGLH
jgi:predicted nucleic acid-binding protein